MASFLANLGPFRMLLFSFCVAPYILALWAMSLLETQIVRRISLVPVPEIHIRDLWEYEVSLIEKGISGARNFAHLFGFAASTTLGACALLFWAGPTRVPCGATDKITAIAGVAITTGIAVAVAAGRSLGQMFVRVANNDASARMFANSFRSLVSTVIAAFGFSALIFVTGQSEIIDQTLGFVLLGTVVGIWGERALDYFRDRAEAIVKAPAITAQKLADLSMIDGLTEEDILRLSEESIDSLHALAFVPTPRLFFNTKYSLQRICDLQDQALLVKYVGPDKARTFRATLIIRGAMDLRQLAMSVLGGQIDTANGQAHTIRLRSGCEQLWRKATEESQGQAPPGASDAAPEKPEESKPADHQEPMDQEQSSYRTVTIQEQEWQKMFNILGFSSAEQGMIALSNLVDDEVIKRLVVFYTSAPRDEANPQASHGKPVQNQPASDQR
jgi:hypothetical protein